MNFTTRRAHPDDSLRHLRALAARAEASQHRSRRPERSSQRRHRNLVLLGWALIAVAPLLALTHLIIDVPGAGANFTWWTTTIASYEVVVITVIIGIALAFRAAPSNAVVTRNQPSS